MQEQELQKKEMKNRVASQPTNLTPEEQEHQDAAARQVAEVISGDMLLSGENRGSEEAKNRVQETISSVVEAIDATDESKERVKKALTERALGLGPLTSLYMDPSVSEIMVHRYDQIQVQKNGINLTTDIKFSSEQELQNLIGKLVQQSGATINTMNPETAGKLDDGSRLEAVFPPVAGRGASLTIRKFSLSVKSSKDYLEIGALDKRMMQFLSRCVKGRINIMVYGDTNCGKSTLINMLSSFIGQEEHIVTIQDIDELKLQQKNVTTLLTRRRDDFSSSDEMRDIDYRDCIKMSLRMSPDRIIVGEIRDKVITDFIDAESTGHEGTLTSVHARSGRDLMDDRLPQLYKQDPSMSNGLTDLDIAKRLARAIQLIVQVKRYSDGSRKVCSIVEVGNPSEVDKEKRVALHEIFGYNEETGEFYCTGYIPDRILSELRNNVKINLSILKKSGNIPVSAETGGLELSTETLIGELEKRGYKVEKKELKSQPVAKNNETGKAEDTSERKAVMPDESEDVFL